MHWFWNALLSAQCLLDLIDVHSQSQIRILGNLSRVASKWFFKDYLFSKVTNLKPKVPPPYSLISFIVQWVLSNTIVDICTKTPDTSKYGNFGLTLWNLLYALEFSYLSNQVSLSKREVQLLLLYNKKNGTCSTKKSILRYI